uniref:30S ribosomal protein S3, chloroplastic n=1 Tax=Commiphora gileadensis TaxID=1700993 RepID=A0A410PAA2_9ROSI|nr:ribosomal protein S3 [Commiphora gileadensis]QAT19735.1 ribosomal protein S3 [Commiphora gileadensis]
MPKIKSTWFPTWYNARSSFSLVCTAKKLFRRSTRRSKNTRLYKELCTKKIGEYPLVLRALHGKRFKKESIKFRSQSIWDSQNYYKKIDREESKNYKRMYKKKLNCVNRKLNIAITRIANPYGNPNILAEFIAGQLKNRVSFRKAMKKAIELTEQSDTKGIQVQIAGRIDGKEIARVEWIREGRVPLQTIGAKIDYCSYTVRTIYGVLGIKIWIFVDEE